MPEGGQERPSAPVARIDGVSWTYAGADAPTLSNLNLTFAPGEVVVLCGASGSGKSTALRLLNGLIPSFHEGSMAGKVVVAGLDTKNTRLDQLGQLTGTVLQHPRRQFFTVTAEAELAFAMENYGWDPAIIRDRVGAASAELASSLPIGSRLSELSGGQQQQVALAAAVAHSPQLVLLDEPSSNLSADAVGRLARSVASLKAAGTTVVIAEHRVRYLQDVLDRVVIMRDGRADAQLSAAEFRGASDERLAAEGLRGHIERAVLPTASASGTSVESEGVSTNSNSRISPRALEVRGLRLALGGRPVLDIDHAVFPAGAVTALRGVNGAGKSTLARVLTGLTRSRGGVLLDGRALSRRARQRASAVVMQDVQRQLFAESVKAEVSLAAKAESDSRLSASALRALDLAHLGERHPLSLSGGQQQRLVIATTQLSERAVVVFDEPSSGVDRRHLASIATEIKSTAERGAVVLLISHDEDLLTMAADQELVLRPLAGGGGAGVKASTDTGPTVRASMPTELN